MTTRGSKIEREYTNKDKTVFFRNPYLKLLILLIVNIGKRKTCPVVRYLHCVITVLNWWMTSVHTMNMVSGTII